MINYQTDLNVARGLAAVENKLLLMIWCAPGCISCGQTLQLWDNPKVQPSIDQNFIAYRGPQIGIPPSPTENWIPYAKGVNQLACPLVVIAGPTQPTGQYYVRWGGLLGKDTFLGYLALMVKRHLTTPPVT